MECRQYTSGNRHYAPLPEGNVGEPRTLRRIDSKTQRIFTAIDHAFESLRICVLKTSPPRGCATNKRIGNFFRIE